jgi:hypothetical protein
MTDEETSQGSGSSWWKWALGCGCAAILLIVCAGGLTLGGGMFYMSSTIQDVVQTEVATGEQAQRRSAIVEQNKLNLEFSEPLASGEIDAFRSTITAWKDSESVQDILGVADRMDRQSGGSESPIQTIQGIYNVWRAGTAFSKVGKAYLDAIESTGGFESYYSNMLRVGAVLAAAHEVASGAALADGGAPASDEVAKLLYKEQSRIKAAYGDRLDALNDTPFNLRELADSGDIGVWALAQLPAESYRVWHDMSREERETLIEQFGYAIVGETIAYRGTLFWVDVGSKKTR